MQKILLFVCVNFLSLYMLLACDVCGCGSGSNEGYGGTMPRIGKSFVGLRGYYSAFDTRHSYFEKDVSQEMFYHAEVFGRFYPLKKLQVMASLPYKYSIQSYYNNVYRNNGIGDAAIYMHYVALNTADSLMKKWKHTLSIGGGLKLPTGVGRIDDENTDISPNLLAGTGSWDKLLNINYNIRTTRWGMSFDANYRFNGTNKDDLQFGNRGSVSSRVFYSKAIKNSMLLPQIGLIHEYAAKDKLAGIKQSHSGGQATFLHTGIDFYSKSFAYGLVYQIPIYQNLAQDYVHSHNRMTAQILFFF